MLGIIIIMINHVAKQEWCPVRRRNNEENTTKTSFYVSCLLLSVKHSISNTFHERDGKETYRDEFLSGYI